MGCSNNGVNGVVISFLNKDYELQSWNEQGEITQIEGMLTICFSYISPCSHRDSWKQLYLIIKIPYMVNMPTQQQIFEQNRQLGEQIKELQKRVDSLEKENQILKKENQEFREILGKKGTQWEQTGNRIHRTNPDTGKFEWYNVPIMLNERKIADYQEFTKKFYLQKRKPEKWVSFSYPTFLGVIAYGFMMPESGFILLKQQSEKTTKITVESIKNKMMENRYTDFSKLKKFDELLREIVLSGSEKINISKTANKLDLDRNTVKGHLRIIKQYTKGEYISDESGRWKINL